MVSLVSEIVIDQQTRPRHQTFERSWTPIPHWCPRYSHAHIWSLFDKIVLNHLNVTETQISGALLVASGLLNSYMKFYQDWTKNCLVMNKKPKAHIWAYAPNLIDFGPLIGHMSISLIEANFIYKVSFNYIFSVIYSLTFVEM